jgi:hypothetical protein
MNSMFLLSLAFLFAAFSVSPTFAGSIHALLVGIGDYPAEVGPQFPSLSGPPNDLKLMREWLTNDLGVSGEKVRILHNADATSAGIQKAFDEHLVQGCGPDDVALFYFTGHGTQVPDLGPELDEADQLDEALVTADFRASDTSTWLTDDVIHRHLAALKARHVLVLLDCCHAGSGTRGIKGAGNVFGWTTRSIGLEARPDTSMMEKSSPENHVFLAACGDGELARQIYDDGLEGDVAVFSQGFRSLANSAAAGESLERFEIRLREEVSRRVKEKLNELLDQRPVLEAARKDFSLKAFLQGKVFSIGELSAATTPRPSPGMVDGFTPTGGIRVSLETDRTNYTWTQRLNATVSVDRTAYVRVFHVDPQGKIIQVHPNAILAQAALHPGETLHLPPREPVNGKNYELRITAPGQGLEALIAVASTQPFSDREAREFAGGLFNAIPETSPAAVMSRGIRVEPRLGGTSSPTAAASSGMGSAVFGQAVRIFRTSQY